MSDLFLRTNNWRVNINSIHDRQSATASMTYRQSTVRAAIASKKPIAQMVGTAHPTTPKA